MRLLKQPNRWSCLPTALAMLLDVNIDVVIFSIGHDGSEILFPDLDEPFKRRGFVMEEVIDIALRFDIALVTMARQIPFPVDVSKITDQYMNRPGIMCMQTRTKHHAVAWDGKKIFDPTGPSCYDFNDKIQVFYPAFKIKS